MKNTKLIIRIICGIIIVGSVSFSLLLLKDRNDLAQALKERQFQIDVVNEENQKLAAENESLRRDAEAKKELQQNFTQIKADLDEKVKAGEDKVAELEADLKDVQWKLEQVNAENNTLAKENAALKTELGKSGADTVSNIQ